LSDVDEGHCVRGPLAESSGECFLVGVTTTFPRP
jgi:hypothetical protein